MAKILRFTTPETAALYKDQIKRIRELWNKDLILPEYCQVRQDQRGIEIQDIKHTIFHGRIVGHHAEGKRWRFEIKGKSVDGERMMVVVETNGALRIVTPFWL